MELKCNHCPVPIPQVQVDKDEYKIYIYCRKCCAQGDILIKAKDIVWHNRVSREHTEGEF